MRELKRLRAKFVMRARGMRGLFDNGRKNEHNRYGTKKRSRHQSNSPVSYFANHWREYVAEDFDPYFKTIVKA